MSMTTHSDAQRTNALEQPPAPEQTGGAPPEIGDAPETTAEAAELARLRSELSVLRARLDTRRRRGSYVTGGRRFTAAVLVAITAFALVMSVVGVWAATTVLNTDRWVATVAPLPQNPQVAAAVADYATVQVFEAINVEQRVRTALPRAAFVAGPLAGQLQGTVRKTVTTVLQNERFQSIWVELNRRAHQRAMAIINGTSDVVVTRDNRVDIDLLPLINQVLRQLSTQLPDLFGKQITLPDLSSGEIPDNLRIRVEDALGVTLPANFAQFTIYSSGQLQAVQEAVKSAKRGLVLFVVAAFVLLALALLVSPGRRRTLLQLGLWLVISAVVVTAALRAVRNQLLEQVQAGAYRDGVAAALTSVFGPLRTRGTQLIWIGAVLVVLMYLIGPGRGPTWLRRQLAAGARATGHGIRSGTRAFAAHGPGWIAGHLDLLRVGGLVIAIILALLLSSWTSLLVVALVLAAYEVLVTVIGRSAARRSAPAEAGSELTAPELGAG
jgi:hypothetical protein